LLQTVKIFLV
jgi:hypothetical protein